MKIEIRLFATFRQNRGKIVELELQDPTPKKLLNQLGIDPEDVAILLVNGQDAKFDQELQPGDYLSVFPPVGGG